MSANAIFRPDVRVRLIGGEPFFGPGTVALLRAIQQCGSVAGACEQIALSYSKGRGMLRRMEQELGYPVVRRSKGGAGGGSARVTPQGERLLEAYTRYEEQVSRYAQERFAQMQTILQDRTHA